jgi:hypothetical protein
MRAMDIIVGIIFLCWLSWIFSAAVGLFVLGLYWTARVGMWVLGHPTGGRG